MVAFDQFEPSPLYKIEFVPEPLPTAIQRLEPLYATACPSYEGNPPDSMGFQLHPSALQRIEVSGDVPRPAATNISA